MIDELKAIVDDREFIERSKSMSTSKWAYDPRRCDGQPCPGDCDHCPKAREIPIQRRVCQFSVGEYIVYRNGDIYELGRIKSLQEDGAFVAYSGGDTGAKTSYRDMHKLENAYAIQETSLASEYFRLTSEEEPEEPKVYCRNCAKRHHGCPLQVWCGPQDDDYCSRGVPKE